MTQNFGIFKDFRIKENSHCFHLALCHKTLGLVEIVIQIWNEQGAKRDPIIDLTNALMNCDYILVTGRLSVSGSGAKFEDTTIPCCEITYIQMLSAEDTQDK